jgi:hypothetical protein
MAAGSQIRIDKNGITITTPNQFTARAAQHIFQGGATVNVNFLKYSPDAKFSQQVNLSSLLIHDPQLLQSSYAIKESLSGKPLAEGIINNENLTERIYTKTKENIDIFIGESNFVASLFHFDTSESAEQNVSHKCCLIIKFLDRYLNHISNLKILVNIDSKIMIFKTDNNGLVKINNLDTGKRIKISVWSNYNKSYKAISLPKDLNTHQGNQGLGILVSSAKIQLETEAHPQAENNDQ